MARRNHDDWFCSGCHEKIFASKNKCFKCNISRAGTKIQTTTRKPGDWNCPKCNFLIFANKEKCFKCNTSREEKKYTSSSASVVMDGEIPTTEEKEKKFNEELNSNECVICFDKPKQVIFKHGTIAHYACCADCAKIINETNKTCPICRQKIDEVITLFTS